MEKIKKNILSVLLFIAALVLVFTPWHLFKICSAANPGATNAMGHHMKCYYSGKLMVYTGIVLVILSLLTILLDKKWMKIANSVMAMIIALTDYLLPFGIIKVGDMKTKNWELGFCSMNKMSCVQNTKPALQVILPIIFVLGLILFIQVFLSKNKRKSG